MSCVYSKIVYTLLLIVLFPVKKPSELTWKKRLITQEDNIKQYSLSPSLVNQYEGNAYLVRSRNTICLLKHLSLALVK